MKRIALIVIVLFTQQLFSQSITKKYLIGYWESNSTTLNFYFDEKMKFHIEEKSVDNRQPLDILNYKFEDGILIIEAVYVENNWKSVSKYKFKDENTMIATVFSDRESKIFYNRVSNYN